MAWSGILAQKILKWQARGFGKECARVMLISALAIADYYRDIALISAQISRKALSTRPFWKRIDETTFLFEKTVQAIKITDDLSFRDLIHVVIEIEMNESLDSLPYWQREGLLRIAHYEADKYLWDWVEKNRPSYPQPLLKPSPSQPPLEPFPHTTKEGKRSQLSLIILGATPVVLTFIFLAYFAPQQHRGSTTPPPQSQDPASAANPLLFGTPTTLWDKSGQESKEQSPLSLTPGPTSPLALPAALQPVVEAGLKHVQDMIFAAMTEGGIEREEDIVEAKRRIEALNLKSRMGRGQPQQAQAYNDNGLRSVREGQFTAAVRAFHAASQADPANEEVINNLGYAQMRNGDLDAAEQTLLRTLMLSPGRANAWANLAQTYAQQGRALPAVACFANAYRFSRNREVIRQFLQQLAADENHRVREAARQALQLQVVRAGHSESVQAEGRDDAASQAEEYYHLGRVYSTQGRSSDAIEAYTLAIRLNPRHATAHYNLGVEYGKLGQYRSAVEAYTQAIRLNPDDADMYHNLGVAYGELGQFADAIAAFQQALRLNPNDADSRYGLGWAYARMGERAAALQQYDRLQTLDGAKAAQLYQQIP